MRQRDPLPPCLLPGYHLSLPKSQLLAQIKATFNTNLSFTSSLTPVSPARDLLSISCFEKGVEVSEWQLTHPSMSGNRAGDPLQIHGPPPTRTLHRALMKPKFSAPASVFLTGINQEREAGPCFPHLTSILAAAVSMAAAVAAISLSTRSPSSSCLISRPLGRSSCNSVDHSELLLLQRWPN